MSEPRQVAAAAATSPPADERRLDRTLRMGDVVLLAVGSVIGSGIFLVPGAVLRQVQGDVGIAMFVWLLGGVLSVLGALTYGELAAMNPEAGGLYVFIRDAYGRFPAFLFGWTLFGVINAGAVATLAVAFSTYLDQFVHLSPVAAKVVSVGIIAVMAAINIRGTRQGARVQNVSTLVKAGAILIMGVALLAFGAHVTEMTDRAFTVPLDGTLVTGLGLATIAVLWAYEGWQFVTYAAGEVVDAQRAFPLGIALGTAALVGIYLLANAGYLAAVGVDGMMATDRVASVATTQVLGPWAGRAIGAAVLVAIYSAAHANTLTAPRVYFAMARDGLFFRSLGRVHPGFGTPAVSIAVSSAWAMVLAATGTFEQLLTYVVFAGWLFYALAASAVFVQRRRRPDAPRPFRVPGYPITPLLFVLAAAAIVLNTIIAQPARAAVGLGIVLAGGPAYVLWRRSAAR